MSLSKEERNNYEFRLKAIRDEIDAIAYATQKGMEQGKLEGQQEKMKEIIKNMIQNKFSIEQIKNVTKLTEEEIEKIIKEK